LASQCALGILHNLADNREMRGEMPEAKARPHVIVAHCKPGKRGGFEELLIALAKQYQARGIALHIFLPTRPCEEVARELDGAGANVHTFDTDAGSLRNLTFFARQFRRIRPEAVHIHFSGMTQYLLPAARLAGCRRVYWTMRFMGADPKPSPGTKSALRIRLHRFLCRRMSRVCFVSQGLRDWHDNYYGYSDPNEIVTYNGVNSERFRPRERDPELAASLGLGDGPVVGYTGRAEPAKGFDTLLSAMDMLTPEFSPLTLLHFGDVRNMNVPEEAEGFRRVHGGMVTDIAPYYCLFDALAFPTRHDALPNSCMEASACAVPVVGSAVGGVPEIVADGETGYLVPIGDAEAMADALAKVLRDPEKRRQMGEAARLRMLERFNLTRIAKGIVDSCP